MEQEKDMLIEEQAADAAEQEAPVDIPAEEAPAEPSEMELLQQKYDELNDKHLRLMAEYDNFRKRTTREKDELYSAATAAAVEKFLPIWDNFERAAVYDTASEEFAKGFALIADGFKEVLEKLGLEPVGEVGEPFDPEKHFAVSHIEDESLGDNVVSQVMQKGYRMGERMVRYAMVQTAN